MKITLVITFLLIIAFLGFSCSKKIESPHPQIERVNVADLKTPEIRHEKLTEDQLSKVKKLHETFAEVDKATLETWIDNFKRDMNPDKEIAIWEQIAKSYKNFTSQKRVSQEAKEDAFKTLLMCSMSNDENDIKTLELKVLSQNEALKLCKEFGITKPVTVRQTNKLGQ